VFNFHLFCGVVVISAFCFHGAGCFLFCLCYKLLLCNVYLIMFSSFSLTSLDLEK
jgi:hypothetical protein